MSKLKSTNERLKNKCYFHWALTAISILGSIVIVSHALIGTEENTLKSPRIQSGFFFLHLEDKRADKSKIKTEGVISKNSNGLLWNHEGKGVLQQKSVIQ